VEDVIDLWITLDIVFLVQIFVVKYSFLKVLPHLILDVNFDSVVAWCDSIKAPDGLVDLLGIAEVLQVVKEYQGLQ
jgi:hypothetical protein